MTRFDESAAGAEVSRRDVIRRAGLVTGGVVAATAIQSVTAPVYAASGPLGRTTPVVGLAGSPTPAPASAETLDVVVASAAGGAVPTGTVSLYRRVGSTDTAVAGQQDKPLGAAGSQTFDVTAGAPGSSTTYVAKYSGDPSYLPAESSPWAVSPAKATPTVIVTDSGEHRLGRRNDITATVTGDYGTPTGVVDFSVTGASPGSWTNVSLVNGAATRRFTNSSTGGLVVVRVRYRGDSVYTEAQSQEFTYTPFT